jgi:hypothetical protein
MQFRLELNIKPFEQQLTISNNILLIGSCFTEHISNKLQQVKFNTLDNPSGILFNPQSIQNALSSYINNTQTTEDDLFFHNELYNSWNHHSKFSSTNQQKTLTQINTATQNAHTFLKKADWVIITLGSAFVYILNNNKLGGTTGHIAANCHKVSQLHFNHTLLSIPQAQLCLQNMVSQLQAFNPNINIIFTISPVRHAREGIVQNNRSKAILNYAVHNTVEEFENVFYFPSYELIIDDLRDYRFYAEDLVHPNYAATNYVWEKFTEACIDGYSRECIAEIEQLNIAKNHKPFNADSAMHKKFLQSMYAKTQALQAKYTTVNFDEELKHFSE